MKFLLHQMYGLNWLIVFGDSESRWSWIDLSSLQMAGELDVLGCRSGPIDVLVVHLAVNWGLVDINFKWVDEVSSVWVELLFCGLKL